MPQHPLDEPAIAAGARLADVNGVVMPMDYGDLASEYAAARIGAGLYDARDRGLIELRGNDRAAWLNNLVTNTIKPLQPGDGNYAFAINLKGRILADFNMLVLDDAIWLDIDRRLISKVSAHFERYTITEDVTRADRSDEFVRLGLLGPQALEIADALGVSNAAVMPALASTPAPLMGKHRLLVRHDFAGVFGVEFHIEAADAAGCWNRLLEIGRPVGLRPVGRTAVNVLRIEAGIPWYGQDIDEDTLPAETDQIERAVSYVKGCYLGQEVVERMRSRGALPRKLVGLRVQGTDPPEPGISLLKGDVEVGRLTSTCRSLILGAAVGLGYVKTGHNAPGTQLAAAGAHPIVCEVVALPFRRQEMTG